ncbi:Hsp70 family protein [Rhodococcus sp. BP-349]|uniref:Hsp70 family protein n=1 Tax=unclassified Rhodococcus (in: high G+C Gram-positive bacteria) TaxID=192944 RepID=UPI001C9A996F|nr:MULTISPECIES: Hsp70 family protein [unclassified Rhodococcus (in: high G+C Gram-positive bacteria)]MBY6537462.1 Hsp70 family protein [Rhodococcus sp. BP-363]MBY6541799.1 Hsp70 family protein [Rhodococcus sp. BP-369]MBY6561029.1 Hsp70 family protein [Rhodococcus sp. BP-370]MBY6575321.1 Hsp70 family protein [Rhodococcus sp. BP-364]MBY6584622.1 Hsp70 family protein [Rhodococcus sp. BP-358]
MRAVVGISLGASAIRAAVMDPMGRALLGTETVAVVRGSDRLEAAVDVVDSVCARHGADRDAAVLVVPDEPRSRVGTISLSVHTGGCVRLASELGAQLMYLRMRGLVESGSTIAVVDMGKTGTSVSVVDVATGFVKDATWTDRYRGSAFADSVREHLLAAYGTAEPLSPHDSQLLTEGVEWAMEMIALHRVVRVGGPFVGGTVNVWRTTVDRLMLDYVTEAAEWVSDVVRRGAHRVDAVVLAGGPANLPLLRGVFAREWGSALVMPQDPQSIAATGAALLAARRSESPFSAPLPLVPTQSVPSPVLSTRSRHALV